jgi:hypothetical protein
MTVYVDDFRVRATVSRLATRWLHLFVAPGEDLEELHRFARKLGLKREWFQGRPEHRHPHYDMTDTNRDQALQLRATPVSWRQAGQMLAGQPVTGMVHVRLAGEQEDLDPVITLLREASELFHIRGPRDNREDPGVRYYIQMTMRPA